MSGATVAVMLAQAISSGGGTTPTAPSIVGTPQVTYNNGIGSTATVTLTGLVVGDLIVVGESVYQNATVVNGTVTAPGHTFARIAASDVVVNADLTMNGLYAVATTSGSLTLTLSGGDYRGFLAFRVQNYDPSVFDGTPVTTDVNQGSGANVVTTLNPTSYTHDLVLAIVNWYDSDRVMTYDAAWPLIPGTGSPGSNNGSNSQNQMLVIGKQVTATGTYTPTIVSNTLSTDFGVVAFAIKGKNV